jgi:hypothetical protein
MTTSINLLTWILRLAFLAALIIGVALWMGQGYSLVRLHMWLGFIITFVLLALVVVALLARMKPALPLITVLWAVALPVIGIAQLRIMPGPNHWLIRVIHVILGLGAIGLGEALAKRSKLRPATE